MEFNWSALDGMLGIALVLVVIWAAFKLMKRLLLAFILIVVLAAVFTSAHLSDPPFVH